MALGYTVRAFIGNYKWTVDSLNQNAELEMMVCKVGGSFFRPDMLESLAGFLCAGEGVTGMWHGKVEVLALLLPIPHFPGCSISCMAVSGCKIALLNIPPSLVDGQGLYSLWNKAWPSPLRKHWHIQVILSMLLAKLRIWGFLKLGGQLEPHLLCHPPAAPRGTTASRENWDC